MLKIAFFGRLHQTGEKKGKKTKTEGENTYQIDFNRFQMMETSLTNGMWTKGRMLTLPV